MTDDRVTPPDFDPEEVLHPDDDRFDPENVAIVTGAASGIGRATALALAANDLTVLGCDVDDDGLDATVARADELGLAGRVETVAANLTESAHVDRVVARAADAGAVTFLANVAGLQHIDPIDEFPTERFDLLHDVMVRAPFLLAKACLPHMRASDGGCIGNMASVHGRYVTADKVAYNVSKFGIRGLTQSIAAEGEGAVRAFSVSTGYVKTPLVTEQIPDTAEQRGISVDEVVEDVMLGQSRTKEMMTPLDVANLFVFGFSKHARHLNGGDLLFDGGMTLTYG
ncbi:SDR family NAD(P)-dependent oxidoreductase [Haladaptatus salinisoli]|uniref:SDR family NAD(P)-dependent oxidoreductase n=1 Tax=Haladaptatus salinisoli TaxID=2884876 RepID=UPI001D0ABE42|nr:SDR family NAD(P)-dependent oxidoreductase [Haladaptatus salinisoli]